MDTTVFLQAGSLAIRFDDCAVEEFEERLMPVARYSIEGARQLRDLLSKGIETLEQQQ